jgi:sugar phosphate permease
MAGSCLIWGLMVVVLTQARSFRSALVVRFLLGVFEAAVTPGLTLMTGFYYTRNEIPLQQCIWYSSLGWGGIIGSYISMGISTLPANFEPERWELLFFILGGVTMIWAVFIYAFLPDSPANARFLTQRERLIAVKRVAGNDTGIKNRTFNRDQVTVALTDPKTILVFISVFAAAIPNGVVNSFSTIINRDMGFSVEKTTQVILEILAHEETTDRSQLKSVGDAVQIVALLIGGIIALNVPNSRLATATFANILCTVASACMACLPRTNTWGRLASFWLVNAQSVGFTISLVTVSSNMGGYTHRNIANTLIY